MIINGKNIEVFSCNTVIVGTGAAGYNAALSLYKLGQTDIVVVTEGINFGTSRNTGSDKQTYYKMNLCADHPDSPHAMASDLFGGKCVDGDIAYAEAALSVPCFLRLADFGVPFPVNRYGEYVGYKTDHDPRARATSAGPLTSKLMTECLQTAVEAYNIPTHEMTVVSVIKKENTACGLLAFDFKKNEFSLFRTKNIIFATGGPAGIYADSVYPECHSGSSGILFEAGVRGKNLTEWQYGLASVLPRWNVSGTYMQVLPCFVSVDENGKQHEFLKDYFLTDGEHLSAVFRKGYEWPFDSRKVSGGSSVIDLLVYRETKEYGRRVYLDYRKNPCENMPYNFLDKDAKEYLENAGAQFGTPVERLKHMNAPAVELYRSKGVDLECEMLEIALSAQHNNGGAATDMWWQTNITGLFAAGEVAGTHGIYRPGGSALNAGQAGSLRAAQYISAHRTGAPLSEDDFAAAAEKYVLRYYELCDRISQRPENAEKILAERAEKMSRIAGAVRNTEEMQTFIDENNDLLKNFGDIVGAHRKLFNAFRLRDTLISQICYLSAMLDYSEKGGKSRGSAIYTDKNGKNPRGLPQYRYTVDDGGFDDEIQEISYTEKGCTATFRPVRPLPEGGGFFENVWRDYRKHKNIY